MMETHMIAAQQVCRHAISGTEARMFLSMLGLWDGEQIVKPTWPGPGMDITHPADLPIGTKKANSGRV